MNTDLNTLHNLLINRIYHEDALLSQRTYNFVTVNAFLATAFALTNDYSGGNDGQAFAYIIMFFALLFALSQVFLGQRTARAILFWREYALSVEGELGIAFDRKLFEFYKGSEVDTLVGKIAYYGDNKRPMNQSFPWYLKFSREGNPIIPSPNTLVGITIPWLVVFFWSSCFIVFSIIDNKPLMIATAAIIVIPAVLLSIIHSPAIPKRQQLDDSQTS